MHNCGDRGHDRHDTTSREDGYTVLATNAEQHHHGQRTDTYDIITGWDGTPAGAVVEGTLMRVCVRK